MTERGIIFSADSIEAILAWRKTQTRRTGKSWRRLQPGTRLWVKRKMFARKADAACCLDVVAVRQERLQDIFYADILAEGFSEELIRPGEIPYIAARFWFFTLWDSLHPDRDTWYDNPEVTVIEFRLVKDAR